MDAELTLRNDSFYESVKYSKCFSGLFQKRHNFIVDALELHLSCIKPSIWCQKCEKATKQSRVYTMLVDGSDVC